MDARPQLEAALEVFALPATVTPPDAPPVETRAFWLPATTEGVPGAESQRAENRRVLVIPIADVPAVPRHTVISIAEAAYLEPSTWRVDSMERYDSDHHRVVVRAVD